jgi:ATP-dependent RNA helicase DDX24/MAK5
MEILFKCFNFIYYFSLIRTHIPMATLRKKYSKNLRRFHSQLDASLEWKPVDTSGENLGNYDEAMFYGLEEVDGNAYLQKKKSIQQQVSMGDETVVVIEEQEEKKQQEEEGREESEVVVEDDKSLSKKKSKKNKDQAKREKAKKDKAKARVAREREAVKALQAVRDQDAAWASLSLHQLLVSSLGALSFSTPTPIQVSAIPKVQGAGGALVDVVGSAETGSGKMLAFGLPVLHALLHSWEQRGNLHSPFALILAPTRELAMQITSVLKDVCQSFRTLRRVEVVNVIGGLSEHKQRRQLSSAGKPCHVLVATPGRLCDLLDDESVAALQDLSCLRFLVVDEADRMVEDGHFPELHKVFSRIRQHEDLAARGLCPVQEARKAREGGAFDEDGQPTDKREEQRGAQLGEVKKKIEEESVEEFDLDAAPFEFEAFPSAQQLQQAREAPDLCIPLHEREEEDAEEEEEEEEREVVQKAYVAKQRQTLLFSATAINVYSQQSKKFKSGQGRSKGAKKKRQLLLELGLPEHLCQLLETVGLQDETRVAHVLLDQPAQQSQQQVQESEEGSASKGKKRKQPAEAGGAPVAETAAVTVPVPALPQGLQQLEVRVATEDKDAVTYLYLLKNSGRTLIFVNSIKTARRVDGLLRALGLNCRCIHAQLQQKQRIRALESFVTSPVGILVATDVAARGLDLPKIQFVLHYDIARSPQVYIHRSGRTARAGQSGVALSVVAPEDSDHHRDVCALLQKKALPLLRGVDLGSVPLVRERVKLAKKIFLASFLAAQSTKQQSWLEHTAKEAGLAVDDRLLLELSQELDTTTGARRVRDEQRVQRALQADRAQLRALLGEPYQEDLRVNPRQKRALIVVAK